MSSDSMAHYRICFKRSHGTRSYHTMDCQWKSRSSPLLGIQETENSPFSPLLHPLENKNPPDWLFVRNTL